MKKLSPQMIRAIKESPKGKLPKWIEKILPKKDTRTPSAKAYQDSTFGKTLAKHSREMDKLVKPLQVIPNKKNQKTIRYEDGSSKTVTATEDLYFVKEYNKKPKSKIERYLKRKNVPVKKL